MKNARYRMSTCSKSCILNFIKWELKDKIDFIDYPDYELFTKLNKNCILDLSSEVIRSESNGYIKKGFLQILVKLYKKDIIYKRKIINFFLDEKFLLTSFDTSLFLIQNLWKFSDDGTHDEISQFYLDYESEDQELMSEKFLALAFLYAYKASQQTDKEKILSTLNETQHYLQRANECIENRSDARCLLEIYNILMSFNDPSRSSNIKKMQNECSDYIFNALSSKDYEITRHLFSLISSIIKMTDIKQDEWLDFCYEINLLRQTYESIYDDCNFANPILEKIITSIRSLALNNYITPILSFKLCQESLRINKIIEQSDLSSPFFSFLQTIVNTNLNRGKNKLLDEFKKIAVMLYPDIANGSICSAQNIQDIIELILNFETRTRCDTPSFIHSQIISSLHFLQNNHTYQNIDENSRNSYLRDLLQKNFIVLDQSLSGNSAKGKRPGEVDLLIKNSNNSNLSFIEAMNLTCVNKKYISEHITKIFGYDLSGCLHNYIIAYVNCTNFGSFWSSYKRHVASFDLIPFPIISNNEIAMKYSNIKCLHIIHERYSTEINLYHFAVLFSNVSK